jgi:hypothetical protein
VGQESADRGQLSLRPDHTGYPLVTVASTKEEADWPLLFQEGKKEPLAEGGIGKGLSLDMPLPGSVRRSEPWKLRVPVFPALPVINPKFALELSKLTSPPPAP